ncbi:hypothetical protein [Sphaerotilus microaerophilus]|uniref:Nucleotide-binding protein n=1 Tax=Sphaerotilus microaerophilus TaxID=2914710 RepID=A0ABN6PUJ8_9BURK|nr:hypothetical protein [Sphaerotilus sp. FB-5]BDI08132.1 hypothetical protein CATMQ487_51020 [Sphaerotilus sp. FB-5]
MQRVYISDTNIWIDFGQAGLLDALFELPFTFVSTDIVVDELNNPAPAGLLERGLVVETLAEEAVEQLFTLMAEHGNSSLADVSCYLIAKMQGLPLLTGDGRLRKQAAKDGVQVHGALWLLDQLVAHDIVTKAHAAAALQTMLDAGARLPPVDCAHRLAAWRT